MSGRPALAAIQAVLLDIEGTTTPVAFVVDVLFPYARRHLRRHLAQHATSPEYASLRDQLRGEHDSDRRSGEIVPPWVDVSPSTRLASVTSYVEWLMDRDRKSTALKTLQGRVWEEGYGCGELIGEVFPDVPAALTRWHARQMQIAIFSSGSAFAQRLLFRHSSAGDLTGFLRAYFDTTMGTKTDAASYGRIARALGVSAGAMVFLSDVTRELDAARAAGMHTRLAVRPGNLPPSEEHAHVVIRAFDELVFSS